MLVSLVGIFFGVIVCRHFECCLFKRRYRSSKRALSRALRRREREAEGRRDLLTPEEVLWRVQRLRGQSTMSTSAGDSREMGGAQQFMIETSDQVGRAEEPHDMEMRSVGHLEDMQEASKKRSSSTDTARKAPWWKFWSRSAEVEDSSDGSDSEVQEESLPVDLDYIPPSKVGETPSHHVPPLKEETYGDATGNFSDRDINPRNDHHRQQSAPHGCSAPPTPPPIGWSSNLAAFMRKPGVDESQADAVSTHTPSLSSGPALPTRCGMPKPAFHTHPDSLMYRQSLQEDSIREPQQPIISVGYNVKLAYGSPTQGKTNRTPNFSSSSGDGDEDGVRSVGSEEADRYHKGNVMLPPHLVRDNRLQPQYNSQAKRNSAVSLYGPAVEPSPPQLARRNPSDPPSTPPPHSAAVASPPLQKGIVVGVEVFNPLLGSGMSFGLPMPSAPPPMGGNLVELWADDQIMRGTVRTPTQSFLMAATRGSSGGSALGYSLQQIQANSGPQFSTGTRPQSDSSDSNSFFNERTQ
eukprot:GILI01011584.1.p1 GENE.GILI01011584.1~~GILI01011584.1.p1  ORF type:complete len:533 (+),score=68.93 GILI01011584.1:34-1599(+)